MDPNLKKTEIFGRNPVMDALDSDVLLDKIYILNSLRGPYEIQIRNKCREKQVPLIKVPEVKLSKFRHKNHQGVVAVISPITFYNIEELVPWVYEQGKDPFILVLDGVTDVRNFGAIARSALAFNVSAILISSKKSAAVNSDAIKSSAGALLKIPVCRSSTILEGINYLKSIGLPIYSAALRNAKTLNELNITGPKVVVMGSEDRGVSREVLQLSDEIFKIPQSPEMESLNVSVASGIILYHCFVNQ